MLSDGANILKTRSGGLAAEIRTGSICACGGRAARLQDLLNSHVPVLLLHPTPSCPSLMPRLAKLVMLCASAGEETSLVCLAAALSRLPDPPAIGLVAEESSEELAIAALRSGVKGYWRDFPTRGELLEFIEEMHSSRAPCPKRVQSETSSSRSASGPVLCRELRNLLQQLAPVRATTLITGETGTGKEVAADFLHTYSGRSGPFVAVNCAALPEALAESELFGYERGAFTGATQARAGKIELAKGGTVLLDEIGDMPLSLQCKLLRTIETRTVHRLGAARPVPVDVRFIAATNRSLKQMMEEGRFRQDLYYRLSVTKVELPPLRERTELIEPLVQMFIAQLNADYNGCVEGFTPEALSCLAKYDWPGNIRELRNVLESIMVRVHNGFIDVHDLPLELIAFVSSAPCKLSDERSDILSALRKTQWNKSDAAKALNWSRTTLYRKIARYHIG
jgi:transcriptional regulator with PAS, ATPase and Fis domain